jgi:SAM-dependent methyltransferase
METSQGNNLSTSASGTGGAVGIDQLNVSTSTITQISKEKFLELSEQIDSSNSNTSVFKNKTTAPEDYKLESDKFFLVSQPDGQIVIFSVCTKNIRAPFNRFVRPLLLDKIDTRLSFLVQETHFSEGANLEHAVIKLSKDLAQGSIDDSNGNINKTPTVGFSFSADCPKLALALENINALCVHFSQTPSSGTTCSSLADFYFSFIVHPEGFNQNLYDRFKVAKRILQLRIEKQFDYDDVKLDQFYKDELTRSQTVWANKYTKRYLQKTRDELQVSSPEHRHLEVGSGFFPDYLLLQDLLNPNGSITIFEREKRILDIFRSEHENNPSYKDLRFMPTVDVWEDLKQSGNDTFDSIRIVDFFEFVTDENLKLLCRNLFTLLKPGGRLVIAEKNLHKLNASDPKIDTDCNLFKGLFALNSDSGPNGNIERSFTDAGFELVSNETTLQRNFTGTELATFLPWTRLDNFHAYVSSVSPDTATKVLYNVDIQQIVFTKK